MDSFLPSEVARLVLGYLRDEGCEMAAKYFLKECIHLREYVSLLQKGEEYPTDILGMNLTMILHTYRQIMSLRTHQMDGDISRSWTQVMTALSQLRLITDTYVTTPVSVVQPGINLVKSSKLKQSARASCPLSQSARNRRSRTSNMQSSIVGLPILPSTSSSSPSATTALSAADAININERTADQTGDVINIERNIAEGTASPSNIVASNAGANAIGVHHDILQTTADIIGGFGLFDVGENAIIADEAPEDLSCSGSRLCGSTGNRKANTQKLSSLERFSSRIESSSGLVANTSKPSITKSVQMQQEKVIGNRCAILNTSDVGGVAVVFNMVGTAGDCLLSKNDQVDGTVVGSSPGCGRSPRRTPTKTAAGRSESVLMTPVKMLSESEHQSDIRSPRRKSVAPKRSSATRKATTSLVPPLDLPPIISHLPSTSLNSSGNILTDSATLQQSSGQLEGSCAMLLEGLLANPSFAECLANNINMFKPALPTSTTTDAVEENSSTEPFRRANLTGGDGVVDNLSSAHAEQQLNYETTLLTNQSRELHGFHVDDAEQSFVAPSLYQWLEDSLLPDNAVANIISKTCTEFDMFGVFDETHPSSTTFNLGTTFSNLSNSTGDEAALFNFSTDYQCTGTTNSPVYKNGISSTPNFHPTSTASASINTQCSASAAILFNDDNASNTKIFNKTHDDGTLSVSNLGTAMLNSDEAAALNQGAERSVVSIKGIDNNTPLDQARNNTVNSTTFCTTILNHNTGCSIITDHSMQSGLCNESLVSAADSTAISNWGGDNNATIKHSTETFICDNSNRNVTSFSEMLTDNHTMFEHTANVFNKGNGTVTTADHIVDNIGDGTDRTLLLASSCTSDCVAVTLRTGNDQNRDALTPQRNESVRLTTASDGKECSEARITESGGVKNLILPEIMESTSGLYGASLAILAEAAALAATESITNTQDMRQHSSDELCFATANELPQPSNGFVQNEQNSASYPVGNSTATTETVEILNISENLKSVVCDSNVLSAASTAVTVTECGSASWPVISSADLTNGIYSGLGDMSGAMGDPSAVNNLCVLSDPVPLGSTGESFSVLVSAGGYYILPTSSLSTLLTNIQHASNEQPRDVITINDDNKSNSANDDVAVDNNNKSESANDFVTVDDTITVRPANSDVILVDDTQCPSAIGDVMTNVTKSSCELLKLESSSASVINFTETAESQQLTANNRLTNHVAAADREIPAKAKSQLSFNQFKGYDNRVKSGFDNINDHELCRSSTTLAPSKKRRKKNETETVVDFTSAITSIDSIIVNNNSVVDGNLGQLSNPPPVSLVNCSVSLSDVNSGCILRVDKFHDPNLQIHTTGANFKSTTRRSEVSLSSADDATQDYDVVTLDTTTSVVSSIAKMTAVSTEETSLNISQHAKKKKGLGCAQTSKNNPVDSQRRRSTRVRNPSLVAAKEKLLEINALKKRTSKKHSLLLSDGEEVLKANARESWQSLPNYDVIGMPSAVSFIKVSSSVAVTSLPHVKPELSSHVVSHSIERRPEVDCTTPLHQTIRAAGEAGSPLRSKRHFLDIPARIKETNSDSLSNKAPVEKVELSARKATNNKTTPSKIEAVGTEKIITPKSNSSNSAKENTPNGSSGRKKSFIGEKLVTPKKKTPTRSSPRKASCNKVGRNDNMSEKACPENGTGKHHGAKDVASKKKSPMLNSPRLEKYAKAPQAIPDTVLVSPISEMTVKSSLGVSPHAAKPNQGIAHSPQHLSPKKRQSSQALLSTDSSGLKVGYQRQCPSPSQCQPHPPVLSMPSCFDTLILGHNVASSDVAASPSLPPIGAMFHSDSDNTCIVTVSSHLDGTVKGSKDRASQYEINTSIESEKHGNHVNSAASVTKSGLINSAAETMANSVSFRKTVGSSMQPIDDNDCVTPLKSAKEIATDVLSKPRRSSMGKQVKKSCETSNSSTSRKLGKLLNGAKSEQLLSVPSSSIETLEVPSVRDITPQKRGEKCESQLMSLPLIGPVLHILDVSSTENSCENTRTEITERQQAMTEVGVDKTFDKNMLNDEPIGTNVSKSETFDDVGYVDSSDVEKQHRSRQFRLGMSTANSDVQQQAASISTISALAGNKCHLECGESHMETGINVSKEIGIDILSDDNGDDGLLETSKETKRNSVIGDRVDVRLVTTTEFSYTDSNAGMVAQNVSDFSSQGVRYATEKVDISVANTFDRQSPDRKFHDMKMSQTCQNDNVLSVKQATESDDNYYRVDSVHLVNNLRAGEGQTLIDDDVEDNVAMKKAVSVAGQNIIPKNTFNRAVGAVKFRTPSQQICDNDSGCQDLGHIDPELHEMRAQKDGRFSMTSEQVSADVLEGKNVIDAESNEMTEHEATHNGRGRMVTDSKVDTQQRPCDIVENPQATDAAVSIEQNLGNNSLQVDQTIRLAVQDTSENDVEAVQNILAKHSVGGGDKDHDVLACSILPSTVMHAEHVAPTESGLALVDAESGSTAATDKLTNVAMESVSSQVCSPFCKIQPPLLSSPLHQSRTLMDSEIVRLLTGAFSGGAAAMFPWNENFTTKDIANPFIPPGSGVMMRMDISDRSPSINYSANIDSGVISAVPVCDTPAQAVLIDLQCRPNTPGSSVIQATDIHHNNDKVSVIDSHHSEINDLDSSSANSARSGSCNILIGSKCSQPDQDTVRGSKSNAQVQNDQIGTDVYAADHLVANQDIQDCNDIHPGNLQAIATRSGSDSVLDAETHISATGNNTENDLATDNGAKNCSTADNCTENNLVTCNVTQDRNSAVNGVEDISAVSSLSENHCVANHTNCVRNDSRVDQGPIDMCEAVKTCIQEGADDASSNVKSADVRKKKSKKRKRSSSPSSEHRDKHVERPSNKNIDKLLAKLYPD